MTNRNNNKRTLNNIPNSPIGFSFTYTEIFNKIIELDCDNYRSWKTNMLYHLNINNFTDLISSEKFIKLRRNKIIN